VNDFGVPVKTKQPSSPDGVTGSSTFGGIYQDPDKKQMTGASSSRNPKSSQARITVFARHMNWIS
jgi:hypothetical protein